MKRLREWYRGIQEERILIGLLLVVFILVVAIFTGCNTKRTACTGEAKCTICKDCSRCRYCAQPGHHCGVCAARKGIKP